LFVFFYKINLHNIYIIKYRIKNIIHWHTKHYHG